MSSSNSWFKLNWRWFVPISFAVSLVVSLIGFGIWYGLWVTVIDQHELGFVFNRANGQVDRIDRKGWIIRTPIQYSVHTIDLRPYQITISANQRVLNAKLVRFNPDGLAKFIEWHGRNAGDDITNLLEILKCYAFDKANGEDCPFLTVVQEIEPNQGVPSSSDSISVGRTR